MEKFDPIDIEFLINSEDVKRSSKQVKDELNSIGQTAEQTADKVNAKIKGAFGDEENIGRVQLLNDKLKEQAKIVSGNKDESLKFAESLKSAMDAFGKSPLEGLQALKNNIPEVADEVELLIEKNNLLNESGQEAEVSLQGMATGLLTWGSVIGIGIGLIKAYGKDLMNYIQIMFKVEKATSEVKLAQEALNKAYDSKEYKTALTNMQELKSNLDLARDGFIDQTKVIEDYNKLIGDTAGKVSDLDGVEQGLADNADAYVQMMFYKAAANNAMEQSVNKLIASQLRAKTLELQDFSFIEQLKIMAQDTSNPLSAGISMLFGSKVDLTGAKSNAEQAADILKEDSKTLQEIYEENIIAATEFSEKLKKSLFGDEKPKTKVLSEYQSLLDKLKELDKEYARKTFTKDEEELQAVRDKFDKIRTLVQRFNADPKNKAQIINLDALNKLESTALESVTYRQSTDKLKIELDEQKKLYTEFENYKTTFGKEAAEKEFAGKIDVATDYYEFLKQKQRENEEAAARVADNTATGPETERVNLLNKAIQKETDEQKQLFNKQLAQLLDYQKKRLLLIENYEAKRAKLVAAGEKDAVAVLDSQHQEELESLDDANIKKLQSYKQLFDGIIGLTRKEAKIVIENAKQLLKILEMSGEMKAKILKQIAEAEAVLADNKLDDISKLAKAVGGLGDSFQRLGDAIGSASLSDAGAFLSGLASGVEDLLTVLDENSSEADVIAAGINGIVNIIGSMASAAAKRREAEEQYYLSMIGLQNQYNLSLNEQIRLNAILDENVFVKDYQGRITDALSAIQSANTEYQEAINKLTQIGKVKTGQRNAIDWGSVGSNAMSGAATGAAIGSIVPVIGTAIGAVAGAIIGGVIGLFGGKKKKDKYGSILQEYPELLQQTADGVYEVNTALAESLIANNLVKGETKAILENILEWQQAIEDARAQIKEVISELSGGLGNDIRNSLVEAFQDGEDAAIKMGESVEKVLENILSNFIFNAIFQDTFDQLEKQMAASMDIGGDGSWLDDFTIFFINASKLTDDFNEALALAQKEAQDMGFDIFKSDSNLADKKQGLAGAIRRELTEATGSELAGLFRGQFDITKRLLEGSEAHFETERNHYSAMLDLVAIMTKIENNTGATVEELQRAYEQLEAIATNTRNSYLADLER